MRLAISVLVAVVLLLGAVSAFAECTTQIITTPSGTLICTVCCSPGGGCRTYCN